jgi:hypothetical protein
MVCIEVVMTYTMNLAQLPASKSVDFLVWVVTNQIGNYQSLLKFIASDELWNRSETITFECSEEEATWILLRWS